MITMKIATVGPDGTFIDVDEPVPPAWITQHAAWLRQQLASGLAYQDETPNQAELPPLPMVPPTSGPSVNQPQPVPRRASAPGAVVASGQVLDASATLAARRAVEV